MNFKPLFGKNTIKYNPGRPPPETNLERYLVWQCCKHPSTTK